MIETLIVVLACYAALTYIIGAAFLLDQGKYHGWHYIRGVDTVFFFVIAPVTFPYLLGMFISILYDDNTSE